MLRTTVSSILVYDSVLMGQYLIDFFERSSCLTVRAKIVEYQSIQRNVPKDSSLQQCCCENLKSRFVSYTFLLNNQHTFCLNIFHFPRCCFMCWRKFPTSQLRRGSEALSSGCTGRIAVYLDSLFEAGCLGNAWRLDDLATCYATYSTKLLAAQLESASGMRVLSHPRGGHVRTQQGSKGRHGPQEWRRATPPPVLADAVPKTR
jgi:hypothetical protein